MPNVCERPSVAYLERLEGLIDAEYKEMPGMRLTFAQIRRLWNLSNEECGNALDHLVSAGRLIRRGEHYCRRADTR
jgi:hypothetical protein